MTGGIVDEFFDLKAGTDADLLAMQCGDFYEFFAEDAETVAAELDLNVSQKSSHGSTYPMAGVPVDDLTPYVSALVERGYRVAVADQYETDDGHAREVTRVVTPGTLPETAAAEAQYLCAIVAVANGYGLAFADVTTGQFHVTEVTGEDAADGLLTELYRFAPVEILPGPDVLDSESAIERVRERTDATVTEHDAEAFAPGRARHSVREQFGGDAIESVGLGEAGVRAAGGVLSYIEETGVGVLASMTRLQRHGAGDHVALDATTQRNLELTETMQGDRAGSLLSTIDHTVTSGGRRLLAEWLKRPRRARAELTRRQAAVEALSAAAMARERLREVLDGAYDLERLASRAASGTADARDLRAAADTLDRLGDLADLVADTEGLAESPLVDVLGGPDRDAAAALAAELDEALVEEPPGTVTQGGLIRPEYDEALADLVADHEAALSWIENLPEREKEAHGITHLSVDRNKTDGYYIQVGNSETDKVPDTYRQIKSLKNSERYTIPELEEREREILRLEERRHDLERDIFENLRDRVADRADLLQSVGRALAETDVYAGLATHAVRNDWTRPDIHDGTALSIEAGRHPVVEQTTTFVPNDLHLDEDRQFLIVTGPNMSGKSTYMRQAALITLLAQVGSFVPATSARVGLVDGIYTRVGALDELAQGRSTFMVEMQELSNILHSATEESLVILDEVGRGTATYDGISIAWAATEYLHNTVGAKTLFATHYHELTALADHLDRVANVHVAVAGDPESAGEDADSVTFLRSVREGPTDRSYGIHVAEMAGVPDPVLGRSREVLDRLREDEAIEARGGERVQAVFDLGSGQYRQRGAGGDGDATATGRGDGASGGDGATAPGQAGGTAGDEATAPGQAGGTAGEGAAATPDGGDTAPDALRAEFGEDADEILASLADLDIAETPPVELMARVREWQDRLGK